MSDRMWHPETRTCAKPRQCDKCGGTIEVGQQYTRTRSFLDGQSEQTNEHVKCSGGHNNLEDCHE